MNQPDTLSCYLVRKLGKDRIEAGIERRPMSELPDGEVLVRVAFSSLNYKDAMAAKGNPGIVRRFPHVPGIDAAGTVVESSDGQFAVEQPVIVTSYELGAGRWGGWAEFIRVPAEWVIPLPGGMSLSDAMAYGTAGLTAGLCVQALIDQGVSPADGDVLVTGATGGVGCLAVQILAQSGYSVVALSGKPDRHDWLMQLGATRVVGRDALHDESHRPLLSAQWAGAVDCIGGQPLATVLRATKPAGCVAACGLVAGTDLPLTVYPFILRGVALVGIDSANCPRARRLDVWNRFAADWKLNHLSDVTTEVSLADIDEPIDEVLAGRAVGRTVVRVP